MRRKLAALRAWIRDHVPPPWIRATMTAASRITTPTYPALYTAAGLLFIFQAPSRTSGEAFEVARMAFEIPTWGCLFLAVGLLEAGALVGMQAHNRDLGERARSAYVVGLAAGAGLAAFWAFLLLAAAIRSPLVSYTSALWLLGIFIFHLASARSLAWREGEPRR